MRIFTLGVTGFDTPGSGNAMPEAHTALNACAQAIAAYLPMLQQSQPKLAEQVRKTYDEALLYLKKNQDFDTFDRLTFLKSHINPLFALTYQMHRALGIEMPEEVNPLPQALNYHADNLFANNLLNVSYFMNTDPKSITDKRIALGRTLFFDPILSANNERACASCHHPDKAFTDGRAQSFAFNHEGFIQRNAPTLVNAVYAERYFYDLREPQLERQIRHVVQDKREFNTDFFDIMDKIQQSGEYQKLFTEAYPEYPDYQVSQWSISDALACYVSTLTGFNSSFDQYVRDETKQIDPAVARGFNLFMGKAACGSCHFAPTFNGTVPPYYQETESEVLGIPTTKDTVNVVEDPDLGRFASGRNYDMTPFYAHSFKTVTVRNIALTAPYMHNGVYTTLEEVVNFYNKGGGRGFGLEVPYQTLPFDNLSLNQQEIKDLVKFMEALTDTTGMTQRPEKLPVFENKPEWNKRKIGGVY
jgi:cytochrome c peroxidase